ncbi:hypothetical protein [Mycobacterium florentinum]|nr:hypothetical protein [Mycobacterium florentinum]MCV7410362.1 hypothetical protein [Mycobacterium florentinum]
MSGQDRAGAFDQTYPSTMRTLLTRPGSVNIAGAAPLSTLKIELNKAV